MLAGVLIVICSALIWLVSEGIIAWVSGAAFLFFGAVVVNGFLSGKKGEEPAGSDWLPTPPPVRSGPVSPRQTMPVSSDSAVALEGDGSYSFDIVGESYYQEELKRIAGPKQEKGKALECEALIIHESDNPHDRNACAVIIDGRKVGHLSKQDAKDQVSFRQSPGFSLSAKALITGGWSDRRGEGSYGVRLDYVPRELPARPLENELYRFMGQKVSRNLSRGDAWDFERSLAEAGDERVGPWRIFRDAAEYLQSPEGREDYDIKKPSLKQLREAYASLLEERKGEGDTSPIDDADIHEKLVDLFPDLEK